MPRYIARRRNVIAQAHSLRGPAGSGAHGARSEPRRALTVCPDCWEPIADCGCPVHPIGGKGRAARTARSESTAGQMGRCHTLETTR